MYPACPVCHGRGEVEAGITGGFVKTGADDSGFPLGYPTWVRPNPHAMITVQTGNRKTEYRDIAFLELNPLVPLWGIAVCGVCHGTGMQR